MVTPTPLPMVRVGMAESQTVPLGRNGSRGVRLAAAILLMGGVEAEVLLAAGLEGVVTTIPHLLITRRMRGPLAGIPLRKWLTC